MEQISNYSLLTVLPNITDVTSIKQSASDMLCRTGNYVSTQPPWFDKHCYSGKKINHVH